MSMGGKKLVLGARESRVAEKVERGDYYFGVEQLRVYPNNLVFDELVAYCRFAKTKVQFFYCINGALRYP